jgi:hypothetical protein
MQLNNVASTAPDVTYEKNKKEAFDKGGDKFTTIMSIIVHHAALFT